MADKDIVIDLIDTLHEDEHIATSERLSKLLRDAATEIQLMRNFLAFPPDLHEQSQKQADKNFPETQGND